jgi:hypothetical protein
MGGAFTGLREHHNGAAAAITTQKGLKTRRFCGTVLTSKMAAATMPHHE